MTTQDASTDRLVADNAERERLRDFLAACRDDATVDSKFTQTQFQRWIDALNGAEDYFAELTELKAHVARLRELLRKCRDEMGGLPRSLGYSFTHLPEIDAALATTDSADKSI